MVLLDWHKQNENVFSHWAGDEETQCQSHLVATARPQEAPYGSDEDADLGVSADRARLLAGNAIRIDLSRRAAPNGLLSRDASLDPGSLRRGRGATPALEEARADVIDGGLGVLVAIVRFFALDEILVSEADILDELTLSLLEVVR